LASLLCAGAIAVAVGLAPLASARADSKKYGELLKRVPDTANVLMLIDADGLFDSKLGQNEKWREEAATAGGLGLADDVSRMVIGAHYDLDSLHENAKVGVTLLRGDLPDLETLARRVGGYVETLQNVPVVWTPRGFTLLAFPPRTLAFVEQADRQAMARWLQGNLLRPKAFPAGYADRALFRADAGSQIVLALNLNEAVSAKAVEPWLYSVETIKDGKSIDVGSLARQLADVQSAFLQIDVKEGITGTLRVDFKNKIDYLAPYLKSIILTAIEDYGAMLPELSSWSFRLDQNKQAIEMSGRLGTESVRRVLSFARPPRIEASRPSFADAPPAPDGKPPEASKDDVVRTSQAYYHSVTDLLEGLKGVDRPTYRSQKLWYDRYAKQIEELPILGVDTDLLNWGNTIARTLREMASGINYADKDAAYRLAGTANGYGGYVYGGYGYYYGNSKGYDAAVLKKQTNAVVGVQLDQRWEAMEASIADMRRKMTEKYKVEF
jgi:hypothetical protein